VVVLLMRRAGRAEPQQPASQPAGMAPMLDDKRTRGARGPKPGTRRELFPGAGLGGGGGEGVAGMGTTAGCAET